MNRYLVKAFMADFTRNVEHSFNQFLGDRLRPIWDAQWGKQSSWGYRIRDTAYFLLGDGTPLVCGLDAIPKHRNTPRALDPSLVSDHEAWLELYETHMQDWPRIQRTLGSLLLKAEAVQDWRDMFPEHVLQPMLEHPQFMVTDVNGIQMPMQRTRPDLQSSATSMDYNGWTKQMIQLYAGISDAVDTYIGYKFL